MKQSIPVTVIEIQTNHQSEMIYKKQVILWVPVRILRRNPQTIMEWVKTVPGEQPVMLIQTRTKVES